MRKVYTVDQHRDYRKVRPEVVVLGVVVFMLAAGGFFIAYDINQSPTVINEAKNEPLPGVVESVTDDFKTIKDEDFTVDIPSNWTEVNPPEVIVNGQRYYPKRFQGTTGNNIGRNIEIFVDGHPAELPVTKVVSVTAGNRGITPAEISPQCTSFTDYEDLPSGTPVRARWNNIEFTCKPSLIANHVAALETNSTNALKFMVGGREKTYLIVYTDHGSDLDNNLFLSILRSFKAK